MKTFFCTGPLEHGLKLCFFAGSFLILKSERTDLRRKWSFFLLGRSDYIEGLRFGNALIESLNYESESLCSLNGFLDPIEFTIRLSDICSAFLVFNPGDFSSNRAASSSGLSSLESEMFSEIFVDVGLKL